MINLKQKIVTGIALAGVTIAGLCGGCDTRSEYTKLYDSLSPEKQAEFRQAEYNLMKNRNEADKIKKQQEIAAAIEFSNYIEKQRQLGNCPPQSQSNKNSLEQMWDIYKGILVGAGSDITVYEYIKRD